MNNGLILFIILAFQLYFVSIWIRQCQRPSMQYMNYEGFTSSLTGLKNKGRRKIRHAVRDGFTQMKSFLG